MASVFIAQEWIDVYADNNSYTTDMFKLKDSDGKLYGCKYEQYHSIYALEANADGTYNGTLVEGQDSLEKSRINIKSAEKAVRCTVIQQLRQHLKLKQNNPKIKEVRDGLFFVWIFKSRLKKLSIYKKVA